MSKKRLSPEAKFRVFVLLVLVITVGLGGLILYNIKTNPSFGETSVSSCITIIIALVFSYWLVQRKNDLRKQKEILASLLFDLRTQFEKEDMYDLSQMSPSSINMRNRDISNKIGILDSVKEEFSIAADVDFIYEKFDEYKELIGNHINDPGYLQNSSFELKRPIMLISTKLFEIAFGLYR